MTKYFRFVVPISLLATLCVTSTASAGNFWDPPGADPCDSPLINCHGGGALDMDNWAGAATTVGNELERQAEEDPVKGFIFWFAKTFGPNIPTDPGGGDGGDPPKTPGGGDGGGGDTPPSDGDDDAEKQESTGVSEISDPEFTKMIIDDPRFVMNVRRFLDKKKQGQTLVIDGRKWKLVQKAETNRKKKNEYVAVLVPVRDNGKKQVLPGFTMRAIDGKLYLAVPKPRKR